MAESTGERTIEYLVKEKKRPPFLVDILTRLVKTKPLGTVGGFIVIFMFLVGIFADQLAPYGMNEFVLSERLLPPSTTHFFGTDNLGRDLLSRIIYGARISMVVGLSVTTLDTLLGILIGCVPGYLGGKVDLIVQRFVDAWMTIPNLLILLTVLSITGPGLLQVILVLGITRGIQSRSHRSLVFAMRESLYLEAARAIGASTARIVIRHILPNVLPGLIIIYSMGIGSAILAEATVSFLGFGIPPPTPSWGGMLSGPARQYMVLAPWMALWPGSVLALVIYGINMLGDALRDLLDPRLRGGLGRFGGVEKQRAKLVS